eukprot:NODE_11382_length_307_cov_35.069767_g10469_i0.p1 GENE.NODE_11382_length_307_cov_35.069767_g10469_i0~~NODE_11382_length_307_cov_35.069767_g10469_i0.p1  ORF type:complete len:65 (+),score=15.95 NODE_11382_length_307_cov_35.069767_g10469_i0:22-195(+)
MGKTGNSFLSDTEATIRRLGMLRNDFQVKQRITHIPGAHVVGVGAQPSIMAVGSTMR